MRSEAVVSHQQVGLWIIGAGFVVIVLGLIVWAGGLSWFGRLPGDIRIQGQSATVFIPVTSMIVVSVALSLGVNLVLRILRRF